MSDSTTWLETISAAQSQKEVTANALFDAGSPATLFGRHAEACSGLTWGYYGGRLWDGSAATAIANGTLTLANNATNYVESTSAGVVSSNTSAFTAGRIRIAKVTTVSSAVTVYEDHRTYLSAANASAGTVTSVNITQPAAGITASGGPITGSGSITLALANDLAAVEGLSATGIVRRTGTSTWSAGTAVDLTSEVTGALPVASLAAIADLRLLANISGGSLAASANTLTAIIDAIFSSTQGAILYRGGAAWAALGPGSSGEFLKTQGAAANPTWSSVSGASGGTVTSVALSLPAIITVSGSPVTGSGTLTGTLATQSANLTFTGPASGGAATPTFRSLVYADLPTGLPGKPRVDGHTYASTVTLDCSAYDVFEITLTGNITITFSGGTDGQRVLVRLTQDGTGSRLVTWDSGVSFGTDIATAVATTTASKVDYFGLAYNSTASKYHMIAVARGY